MSVTYRSASAQREQKNRKRSRTGRTETSRRSKRGRSVGRVDDEPQPDFEPSEIIPEEDQNDKPAVGDTVEDTDEGDFPGESLPSDGNELSDNTGTEQPDMGLRQRRRSLGNTVESGSQSVDPSNNGESTRWKRIMPFCLLLAVLSLFAYVCGTSTLERGTTTLNLDSIRTEVKKDVQSRMDQMRTVYEKRIDELEKEVKILGGKHKDETLSAVKQDKEELTREAAEEFVRTIIARSDFNVKFNAMIDKRMQNHYEEVAAKVNDVRAKMDDVEKQILEGENSIIANRKKIETSRDEIQKNCVSEVKRKEAEFMKLMKKLDVKKYSNEEQLREWVESNISPIVDKIIQEDLEKYSADRTGLVDYALKAAGASIVAHSQTEMNLVERKNIFAWIKAPERVYKQVPDLVIMPGTSLGKCWPMHGNKGFLLIKLSKTIKPTQLSLEHVSKLINLNPAATPKDFRIYGTNSTSENLSEESHEKLWDSKYQNLRYEQEGRSLQQYDLFTQNYYKYIYFEIRDNYGGSYTTIYRIRVHGESQGWP